MEASLDSVNRCLYSGGKANRQIEIASGFGGLVTSEGILQGNIRKFVAREHRFRAKTANRA
jgi:hypothetical protein